jgi:hypothetical protein
MVEGVRSDGIRSVVGGKEPKDWNRYISGVKERRIEGVCGVHGVGWEEREQEEVVGESLALRTTDGVPCDPNGEF